MDWRVTLVERFSLHSAHLESIKPIFAFGDHSAQKKSTKKKHQSHVMNPPRVCPWMLFLPAFFLEVGHLPRGGCDAFGSNKMRHTVSLTGDSDA